MFKFLSFVFFSIISVSVGANSVSWLQGQAGNLSTSNIVIAQAVTGGIIDIEGTGAICSDGDNTNHWTFGYRDSDKKVYICDDSSGSYLWEEFSQGSGGGNSEIVAIVIHDGNGNILHQSGAISGVARLSTGSFRITFSEDLGEYGAAIGSHYTSYVPGFYVNRVNGTTLDTYYTRWICGDCGNTVYNPSRTSVIVFK